IDVAIAHQSLARFQSQRHPKRASDGGSDVFLDGEDVGQIAIETISPDMRAVVTLDKLSGDSHAVVYLAHRALDEVRRAKLLPHCLDIDVLPLEFEGRGACDDPQIRYFGE